MRDVLYLAWRYLVFHRVKTAILVASLTIVVYLPVGLNVLVSQSAAELTARAEATPLLVGARGSPLELVLNSLYLESKPPAPTRWAVLEPLAASGLAEPIPLYVRFRARGLPIVGTTPEYFEFRRLAPAAGRLPALLGECALGAEAARVLGLGVGDALVSSPESVLDLAGAYPLKMRVVGVLERSHGADDRAVFADVKTAWVIAGIGHGHQDLSRPEARPALLARRGDTLVANASVVQYNEVTAENLDGFHFHGDLAEHPLTAVLAVPRDAKSAVILRGRYQDAESTLQMVRPVEVMRELLDTVLTVQGWVVAAVGLVGVATLATAALVLLLSLRLRRREIETLANLGGSRPRVVAVLASEMVVVLALGAALAGVLTLLTSRFGAGAIRAFLLS